MTADAPLSAQEMSDRLLAVLALHAPSEWDEETFPLWEDRVSPPTGPICLRCSRNCDDDYFYSYVVEYPCPTAIAAGVSGVVSDDQ